MIEGFIQPKEIVIDNEVTLVKYYPNYKRALPWYQDKGLCKQVDNIDFVYDLERLKLMYNYLSKNGECYYIKYKGRLVGDIALCMGAIGMVVSVPYQNRHIGRRAVNGIINRAKEIGLDYIEAEIYDFNEQSKRMFKSLGFINTKGEMYRIYL